MATRLLQADHVVLPDRVSLDAVLVIDAGLVRDVIRRDQAKEPVEQVSGTLLPGFIDLQVNGGGGHSVDQANAAALDAIALHVHRGGAQAFLPTLITAPFERLCEQAAVVARWMEDHRGPGAVPLGLHLEGPFLCNSGVHDASSFTIPTADRVQRLLDACAGKLRLMTLSPNVPGAADATQQLVAAGVTVSLGHGASTDGVAACLDAGAKLATHLFNAMGSSHHRDVGMADLLLDDQRTHCSLICDGQHVHEVKVRQAWAVLGPQRTVLVTDSVAAAGMPDGCYELQGQTVWRQGATVRNDEGQLAGSCLTMADAATNLMRYVDGAGVWSLAQVAAQNPARLLGLSNWGRIEPGQQARFSRLTPDGRVVSC